MNGALIRDGFTLKGTPRRRAMPVAPERNKLHKRGYDTPLHPILCFIDHKKIERTRRRRNEREGYERPNYGV